VKGVCLDHGQPSSPLSEQDAARADLLLIGDDAACASKRYGYFGASMRAPLRGRLD
jgi:hypothetical protein